MNEYSNFRKCFLQFLGSPTQDVCAKWTKAKPLSLYPLYNRTQQAYPATTGFNQNFRSLRPGKKHSINPLLIYTLTRLLPLGAQMGTRKVTVAGPGQQLENPSREITTVLSQSSYADISLAFLWVRVTHFGKERLFTSYKLMKPKAYREWYMTVQCMRSMSIYEILSALDNYVMQ